MSNQFQIHNLETAPAPSQPFLARAQKSLGMIPNLYGVLAESPQLLEAYQSLNDLFSHSSLNAEELTVVWQTINVEHQCHYCVPAHTAVANMMKVDSGLTQALREEGALPNERLEALRALTLSLVRGRGQADDSVLQRFYDAGYERRQVLDVVLGIAQKTISNYVNHLAKTPLDRPFERFAWKKVGEAVGPS